MGLELVSPATSEPITLDIARRHLRLDVDGSGTHPDDDYISSVLLPAARQAVENYTGRALAPCTYRMLLDAFPDGGIELPMPPLIGVAHVEYVDTSGAVQEIDAADYVVDTGQQLPWVLPVYGQGWPATLDAANVVTVVYNTGYSPTALPRLLMSAMMLMLTNLYDHRGSLVVGTISSELPQSVASLAWAYRVRKGMA